MITNIRNKSLQLIGKITNYLKKQKSLFYYYFLCTLGLFCICGFIYFNYLRNRLPRNIPFELSEVMFYGLLLICVVYCYTIYRHFNPKPINEFINQMLIKIAQPILYFDHLLKNNKYIKPYYQTYSQKTIEFMFCSSKSDMAVFYYIFVFAPRLILLSILMFDVFIVHKIEVFYYFIFLGAIPLLYHYFINSLKIAEQHYFQRLESLYQFVNVMDMKNDWALCREIDFDDNGNEIYSEDVIDKHTGEFIFKAPRKNLKAIHHDTFVSIKRYFEIKLEEWDKDAPINPDEQEIEYKAFPMSFDEKYENYRRNKYGSSTFELTHEDYEFLKKDFYEIEPYLFDLILVLRSYEYSQKSYCIPKVKLFLCIMYLVIWSYILIISFHTLSSWSVTLQFLDFFMKHLSLEDPFSEFMLNENDPEWNNNDNINTINKRNDAK